MNGTVLGAADSEKAWPSKEIMRRGAFQSSDRLIALLKRRPDGEHGW